jgi:hypothetical protein
MSHPSLRAAMLTSALAAALLAPTGASAQSLRIDDPTGDSWHELYAGGASRPTGYEPAGSAPNSDIVKVKVSHSARRVKVRTTYVDLVDNAEGVIAVTRIRTSEGLERRAWVAKESAGKPTRGFLTGGGRTTCRGIREKVSFGRNVATVSVPRRCLSDPRWVKVVAGGGNYAEAPDPASYRDIVGTTGPRFTGLSGKIRRG